MSFSSPYPTFPSAQPRVRLNTVNIIIGICLVIYIFSLLFPTLVNYLLGFYTPLAQVQPWRAVTAAFVHSGIMHLICNMAFLWVLGNLCRDFFSELQVAFIFLLSAIGGAVITTWWQLFFSSNSAIMMVGASAGVFGLAAACYLNNPRLSAPYSQPLGLLIVNLLLGFILPGVAWYAHIGGALTGGLMGGLYRSFNLFSGRMAQRKLLSDIPDIVDRDRARHTFKSLRLAGKIFTPSFVFILLLIFNYLPNL